MVAGNRIIAPVESSGLADRAANPRSWGSIRAWHELEPEDRLALVESALKIPANDFADDLPLAL